MPFDAFAPEFVPIARPANGAAPPAPEAGTMATMGGTAAPAQPAAAAPPHRTPLRTALSARARDFVPTLGGAPGGAAWGTPMQLGAACQMGASGGPMPPGPPWGVPLETSQGFVPAMQGAGPLGTASAASGSQLNPKANEFRMPTGGAPPTTEDARPWTTESGVLPRESWACAAQAASRVAVAAAEQAEPTPLGAASSIMSPPGHSPRSDGRQRPDDQHAHHEAELDAVSFHSAIEDNSVFFDSVDAVEDEVSPRDPQVVPRENGGGADNACGRLANNASKKRVGCNSLCGNLSEASADVAPSGAKAKVGTSCRGANLGNGGAQGTSPPYRLEVLLRWRRIATKEENWREAQLRYVVEDVSRSQQRKATGGDRRDRVDTGGWRADAADWRRQPKDDSTQQAQKLLEASPTSWAAQQQAFRYARCVFTEDEQPGPSDVEVVRAMKSILNKLTIERFDALYQQLIVCGIRTSEHVEALMREVFEKATTQHHFVGMYAELCSKLHMWFTELHGNGREGKAFKRILLNRCQLSFEEILRPQEGLSELDAERRQEAEQLHKTRMLGNLKLVGALLERGMLASKILLAMVDELLNGPTSASLESLATLLTAVGPHFDQPGWPHHVQLIEAFQRVKEQVRREDLPSRTKFLLQDLLDLREAGWESRRKMLRASDTPTTLDAVHRRAEEELGERITPLRRYASASTSGASSPPATQAGVNGRSSSDLVGGSSSSRPSRGARGGPVSSNTCSGAGGRSNNARQSPHLPRANSDPSGYDLAAQKRARERPEVPAGIFERTKFHDDVTVVLRELASSLDVNNALDTLLAAHPLPTLEQQATELSELIARVSEQGREQVRRAGFELIAQFFVTGPWLQQALGMGVELFLNDLFSELRLDIPTLPRILRQDFGPVLGSLKAAGLLEPAHHERFVSVVSDDS
eukprot:TRINITY_DN11092_c0_g1_i3.p1 TRINITY_DN11092_c0_g1~~TRINITY_DN11092_c0_g1_i3.p1  ORF type:complete len:928 (+),score=171.34 TRINITY_DN11092_c0_g1_i3:97-2880(+)